mmetsp:Transcript_2012/g.4019  ORF Transcript_2012/g.4019 Transcript_2012/m.4019 type:complete len:125 (+) Transcript_2012:854-1228(+)
MPSACADSKQVRAGGGSNDPSRVSETGLLRCLLAALKQEGPARESARFRGFGGEASELCVENCARDCVQKSHEVCMSAGAKNMKTTDLSTAHSTDDEHYRCSSGHQQSMASCSTQHLAPLRYIL